MELAYVRNERNTRTRNIHPRNAMLHTSLTDHLATVTTVREGCLLSGKTFRQNGVERFTARVILRGPKFLYSKVSKSPL